MKIAKDELIAILTKFNPWWRQEKIADLPLWKRAAFNDLKRWVVNPPAPRAIMLSGARQVGKTTLMMQVIDDLLSSGVAPSSIVYITFDHPILKLAGIEAALEAWREREPKQSGIEYVFLDEAQFIPHWGTWIKHQVDFTKQRRIVFTGSAMPLVTNDQESGVGRWTTIKLTTLSFYEYLQLKKINLPQLPKINSLLEIFSWDQKKFLQARENGFDYIAHFNEYLSRGGFPQSILAQTITQSQKLLREDIIDKALKRDMTALFGVRRVLDLEQIFLYLCMHDGGILDMISLCSHLESKRQTVQNYIDLLEATHLIYRLQPFGYGKEILRGKYKIYLSDTAISAAVLLKGKIENPESLGVVTESAVIKHLFGSYSSHNIRFSYWQESRSGLEVDMIAETDGNAMPFEIKYRSQASSLKDCKGLIKFCTKYKPEYAFIATRSLEDFGIENNDNTKILRIPAALLCYFIGEIEIN